MASCIKQSTSPWLTEIFLWEYNMIISMTTMNFWEIGTISWRQAMKSRSMLIPILHCFIQFNIPYFAIALCVLHYIVIHALNKYNEKWFFKFVNKTYFIKALENLNSVCYLMILCYYLWNLLEIFIVSVCTVVVYIKIWIIF